MFHTPAHKTAPAPIESSPRDLMDKIISFEGGDMDEEELVEFFQEIINSGMVWQLQGSYGRTAQSLINAGHCTLPLNG